MSLTLPRLRYIFQQAARKHNLHARESMGVMELIVNGTSPADGDVLARCYADQQHGRHYVDVEFYEHDGTSTSVSLASRDEVLEGTFSLHVRIALKTWPVLGKYGGFRTLIEMAYSIDEYIDREYLAREEAREAEGVPGAHPARFLDRYSAGRRYIQNVIRGSDCDPAFLRLVATGLVALLDQAEADTEESSLNLIAAS